MTHCPQEAGSKKRAYFRAADFKNGGPRYNAGKAITRMRAADLKSGGPRYATGKAITR